MNKMDLNIDNYDLADILSLFKINADFDINELQKAKKIVLQIHPDKSKLHPDYFRFYLKAYKKLYEIFEFKNKDKLYKYKDTSSANSYLNYKNKETYLDESKKKILDTHLSKKSVKENFNKWFNEEFEKNNTRREEETTGYGDWLSSNEDIEKEKHIQLSDMGDEIELRKKKISQMTVYKGVTDIQFNNAGSYLTGDAPESFSSDLFSQLPYEDLRKAHTETVVPVTIEDYNNIPKFKNVNDFVSYRDSQNMTPLTDIQANKYFTDKNKAEEYTSSINAYKLAKQLEDSKKKQESYWASISYIKN